MKQPTLLIAGEPFDNLLSALRGMAITRVVGRYAQITCNLGDPEYVSWARAAERYAADLFTPDCDLTHQERLGLAAQRVLDEVEEELRQRRQGQGHRDPIATNQVY